MALDQLDPYYRFKMGRIERVSGRPAQKVLITARDKYRYGYHLWADTVSGLLLKADLVNGKGKVLEQFMFTNVTIGGDIPQAHLQTTVDKTDLVMHKPTPQQNTAVGDSKWRFRDLPRVSGK